MFYSFQLNTLPHIYSSYSVSKNTPWQIADNYNILLFISNGSCEIIYNNKSHILSKGDVFFIPANHAYTRRPVNDEICTMHYVHFILSEAPTDCDADILRDLIIETQQRINIEASSDERIQYPSTIYLENHIKNNAYDTIKALVDGIDMFSTDRQIMCGLHSQIHLCSLLTHLSEMTIKKITENTSIRDSVSFPKNLNIILRYIVQNSNQQITLDLLAEYSLIPKYQIIRYFRKYLNTTPINYITDYKIAKSKELLYYHPHLSIKEISDEMGFSSQYYFSKVFLKATGETPSAYRNKITELAYRSKAPKAEKDK